MSQREKLLAKAKRGAELNAENFMTLARGYGIEVRRGGAHFGLYSAEGKRLQTANLPASGRVKRIYVSRLVEMIEEGAATAPDGGQEIGHERGSEGD